MAIGVPEPSSQRVVPGSVNTPLAKWPVTTPDKSVDATTVASNVIDTLNKGLEQHDHKAIADLFLENGYWRDHLTLTWDLRTVKGRKKITSFLDNGHNLVKVDIDHSPPNHGPKIVPMRLDGSVEGILFFVIVTTKYGSGRGVARLIQDKGEWKIWTLLTSLDELRGHEEPLGPKRGSGVQHGAQFERKNWLDRRTEETNFENADPDVLIIGCGQSGLSAHARLKMLNIPTLIIDRSENIGDNWRKRYHQLVLHDPVWYDHLPYIHFPKFWPVFTPKDKLADFLKSYAEMLELNVWTSTTLESSTWDEDKKQWTVVLKRKKQDGTVETRTLHPKHIVQATGHSGKKNAPQFKGMENFKGDVLCHSSEFRGAKKNAKGRKAIVIGSCNSALDISQDFYENGYDVTLIQRSSTCVVSSKAIVEISLAPLYSENGPPTDDADLLLWSMPTEVFKAYHNELTEIQYEHDKELIDGLNKAGFKTDRGPLDCGLFPKYLSRGGGYYIDVGTSQLIINGKVKVKHGVGINEILPHGVRFDDGAELEADEIVCATGYQNMRTATEELFGDEVAKKVDNVWGYDEEGEIRVMWRRSGHLGLWLHGGNLCLCRYYSRLLALQIAAQLDGLSN
ncbi:hypothetical protein F4779DRAFT_594961 [Xylariaceae sp. FL0662B]|nr:hypothetical protein F4779DRAFT_594961 [Xylariaceae sp. FL0662B]